MHYKNITNDDSKYSLYFRNLSCVRKLSVADLTKTYSVCTRINVRHHSLFQQFVYRLYMK